MMIVQVYDPLTQQHFEGSVDAVGAVMMRSPYLVKCSLQRLAETPRTAPATGKAGLVDIRYTLDTGQMAFNWVTRGLSVDLGGKDRE